MVADMEALRLANEGLQVDIEQRDQKIDQMIEQGNNDASHHEQKV